MEEHTETAQEKKAAPQHAVSALINEESAERISDLCRVLSERKRVWRSLTEYLAEALSAALWFF